MTDLFNLVHYVIYQFQFPIGYHFSIATSIMLNVIDGPDTVAKPNAHPSSICTKPMQISALQELHTTIGLQLITPT